MPFKFQRDIGAVSQSTWQSHESLSNHQKAMPWKTANAGGCIEAPVDPGRVLKCVEKPLTKAALWDYKLWYPWYASGQCNVSTEVHSRVTHVCLEFRVFPNSSTS